MTECRGNIRYRTSKPGTIVLARGGTISCTIRDLSETGAGIEVESFVSVPEVFVLLIGGDDKYLRRCKVAWRATRRLGVSFSRDLSRLSPQLSATL